MLCVTDANIWIDLHNADLLDAVFALDHAWQSPDLVLRNDVLTVDRALLIERGLKVRKLSGTELNQIPPLNKRYAHPSPPDLAVLVTALIDEGIVVTGDRALRIAAVAEGATVHGVLWILDELLTHDILSPARAAIALRVIVRTGSYLPEAEVQQRLRRWKAR